MHNHKLSILSQHNIRVQKEIYNVHQHIQYIHSYKLSIAFSTL